MLDKVIRSKNDKWELKESDESKIIFRSQMDINLLREIEFIA